MLQNLAANNADEANDKEDQLRNSCSDEPASESHDNKNTQVLTTPLENHNRQAKPQIMFHTFDFRNSN